MSEYVELPYTVCPVKKETGWMHQICSWKVLSWTVRNGLKARILMCWPTAFRFPPRRLASIWVATTMPVSCKHRQKPMVLKCLEILHWSQFRSHWTLENLTKQKKTRKPPETEPFPKNNRSFMIFQFQDWATGHSLDLFEPTNHLDLTELGAPAVSSSGSWPKNCRHCVTE